MAQSKSKSLMNTDVHSREYAEGLDRKDPLRHFRNEFLIPTKADLKSRTLATSPRQDPGPEEPSIYLCGNSLGLQPRRTTERIQSHLTTWAKKGVFGHFVEHQDSALPPFLHVDDAAAKKMAPIMGASESEVAVMETLTANIHLLMSSFYQPTKEKYKIIMEGKAFPSDRYAIESQIRHHGLDPKDAIILLDPIDPLTSVVSISQVLATIDKYASSTALVWLPGVQYYTGQYWDIKTITAYAHSKGLPIGWDLAHAAGNVELQLHDWDVDFAVWCSYKYLNSGPGGIGALFVHEKHGKVDLEAIDQGKAGYRPRLSGWWGGDKATRFSMGNNFLPIPGAAGFQVGNPSALALTAVLASLEVFAETDMKAIRAKSIDITNYLEKLLLQPSSHGSPNPYRIITPSKPEERGAQLSVLLDEGLLDGVMAELENLGVVVDERKPDVVRVAPAPLYNSYTDVWDFVRIFREACEKVKATRDAGANGSVMANGGKEEKRWGLIK
ncbi:Kynureninase (L-kynurenine hydrolase) [Xylographa soralifera]|nr:Kynureninase (L-kynurenine hydrolase) [Xylographa soralifera]